MSELRQPMSDLERAEAESLGQDPQPNVPPRNGLADAGNEQAYCSTWLSQQCTRILGVTAGLLVVRPPGKGSPGIAAVWPTRNLDLRDLSRAAERSLSERRTVTSMGGIGPDTSPARPVNLLVAVPLGADGEPFAAVVVALATTGGSASIAPESVAEQLRWGAGWLEALPSARRAKEFSSKAAQAASCFDLLVTIGEQPRLKGMAIAIVNDLATRLRCDRVSLGLVRRNGAISLRAISHSATFKNEGRLVDAIETAMEEAVDQRSTVACPPLPSTEPAITIAHRALAAIVTVPAASLMSVALADGKGELIGAITFERHRDDPFKPEILQLVEAISAVLGPIVGVQLRANRLFAGRLVDRIDDGTRALLAPRRPGLKLGAIGVVALLLVLIFARGEHRVTAKSVLEPELQRAAVAPFEGFIRTAPVRAGDTVKRGDILATLEDRDLVLEQLKWRAERDKLAQKQRDARAKHERTNLVILDSQIRQADSQLSLAEEKLSRARIIAPFDGIIVSGDLSQMLGSPIEKGKVLFEIAPLNAYRLTVHVDERDVRYVSADQRGIVALAGMPGDSLPFVLSKITPVTVAEEGRNSFRIEARLVELGPHLRPGMEGVAKIEAGRRSLLWIWTRSLVDSIRLAAWKHLP
jgi:multidrug efflux pump subunit AcrA (membrane-fusion protein)